ncbi:trafficking protein particle complex subunit 6B [Diaphorina citri]|uniref:Trafficking protein particle complex subunit 6B n=1 Tax=Diaphorina citri TaxID=121845 RepID=A0A1S3CZU1_DIACI|nr:trafficking protein particle complex subunit 6B [Diaphorina citri]
MTQTSVADEILLDLIHAEIVSYASHSDSNEKKVCLSVIPQIKFLLKYKNLCLCFRLTKDWTRFKDELDTMKFICTELWIAIYKKQIDNLRTNYQGTYLLQDNSFRFLSKMSTGSQYLESAGKYVIFTCGLIRGALSNLGINAIVSTEINTMPVVKFHIQVPQPHN